MSSQIGTGKTAATVHLSLPSGNVDIEVFTTKLFVGYHYCDYFTPGRQCRMQTHRPTKELTILACPDCLLRLELHGFDKIDFEKIHEVEMKLRLCAEKLWIQHQTSLLH